MFNIIFVNLNRVVVSNYSLMILTADVSLLEEYDLIY